MGPGGTDQFVGLAFTPYRCELAHVEGTAKGNALLSLSVHSCICRMLLDPACTNSCLGYSLFEADVSNCMFPCLVGRRVY